MLETEQTLIERAARITEAIEASGVAQTKIAEKCKVSNQAVTGWKRTGKITKENLSILSDMTGFDFLWLLSGKNERRHKAGVSEPYDRDVSDLYLESEEIDPRKLGKVPLISSVQAGDAELAIDNLAPGDAEDWLYCNASHSRLTYALRVEGESMTSQFGKSYPNGCIIFVDPEQRGHVTPGDHIIAKINGQDAVTFKAFALDGDRAFLKPLNPQYPTNMNEFRVLGLVIGKWES